MNNERHGIHNLGQDPSTFKGKSIWEDVREAGGSIGICGSMQSWPPIDPGPGGFYIPDTFAHDEACVPSYLSPLQAFNLNQVRHNARVVNDALPVVHNKRALLISLARSGVRTSTLFRIATQLLGERFNGDLRLRRPVYQAVLFWDVFRRHFNVVRPATFSTFFTNHIAGVMHRYWRDVFPEDFSEQKRGGGMTQEPLMRFALAVLDEMLADVMQWAENNGQLIVIFASSMGQDAVYRNRHEGVEVMVQDLPLLMQHAGVDVSDYRPLLAMVPQVAVEVYDTAKRKSAKAVLESACTENGEQFIRVQEVGISLSITVGTPSRNALNSDCVRIGTRELTWAVAGLRQEKVDPGTGYHVPEGTLMVYSRRNAGEQLRKDRAIVRADKLKSWMLDIIHHGPSQIVTLGQSS